MCQCGFAQPIYNAGFDYNESTMALAIQNTGTDNDWDIDLQEFAGVDLTVDLDAHRVEVDGQAVHLTATEFGLLKVLAECRGHALTRLEMIERGLGYSYEGLERTVDSHIRNLRRKLVDAGAPADSVETVFGVGYRLAGRGGS